SHAVELVSQSLDQLAEDADSRLAPGGGDKDLIEIGPIDAVEAGRLVVDVDDAHGHEDQAAAQIEPLVQEAVEIRLLDFHLALIRGSAVCGSAGWGASAGAEVTGGAGVCDP